MRPRSLHRSRIALLFLLAGATASPAGQSVDPPFDLYEAGPLELSTLAAGGGLPDVWVLLQTEENEGRAWLLLALPDGTLGADLPGWGRPRYLGRVPSGERVFSTPPPAGGRAAVSFGRSITRSPGGTTIHVTREHPARVARMAHHGFRVLDRMLPTPEVRAPGPPERFRDILERARSASPTDRALRTPEEVEELVERVNLDSLESYVVFLSEQESGAPAYRYWEDNPIRGRFRDYVERKLEEALGPEAVFEHSFTVLNEDSVEVQVANIVGCLASPVPGAGAVFVTAHLDAIGKESDPVELCGAPHRVDYTDCDCTAPADQILADPDCDWNWRVDPAPGGNDNATGVAAILELARILKEVTFEFDIYFVALQAEEIGLVGSAVYADSLTGVDQDLFFALNLDMLGHNPSLNALDVQGNPRSEWLADWIVESAELFVPSLVVEKRIESFGRSDHVSFWQIGVDAVLFTEDAEFPENYPGYHMWTDVWETMFPESGRPNAELQFQLSTQTALATLARFAVQHDVPDLALPPGEIEASSEFGRDRFVAGRPVTLHAFVHNLGNSSLSLPGGTTDSLFVRVTFYDGDPARGALALGERTHRDFFPSGGFVPLELTWTPGLDDLGFHEIHAVLEGLDPGYAISEVSGDNNESSVVLFVEAPVSEGPRVLSHYVFPNPVREGRDRLTLYYELTRDASVRVKVFDLEGTVVGRLNATTFIGDGNQRAANRVTGDTITWEAGDLESGVYVYAIRVFDRAGGLTDDVTGKFALVR
jgi:hypothetical protein